MKRLQFMALAAAAALAGFAQQAPESPTKAALEKAGAKIKKTDKYLGHTRHVVDFEGWDGWVVEPEKAKEGNPWVWCMKWPGAFADGTGQKDCLKRGYHYVYLENALWMNEEGTAKAKRWRDFLVEKCGLAKKVNLTGMSWGGFFSTRYASTYPGDVAAVYLDCPVMSFHDFKPWGWGGVQAAWKNYEGKDWKTDALMPINRAKPIADAKIPVLLLYGGKDATVRPAENCEIFVERFKAAGGNITVVARPEYGHHPHGYEDAADFGKIVDFFEASAK